MSGQPSSPSPSGPRAIGSSPASSGAGRFLKEGLVAWIGVGVVFTLAGLAVPRAYSSAALLEIALPATTGATAAANPESVERQLNQIIDDPRSIEALAREESAEPSKDDLVRVRGSVRVRTRSPRTFELSYQAGTPELSQSGCTRVATAIISHFETLAHPATGSKGEDPRVLLEKRTKELTDFVVAHPEALVGAPSRAPGDAPTGEAARAAADPAIAVLRQEKARIEVRLAQAEAALKAPRNDNPYDDPPRVEDVGPLRDKVQQLRNAILAHQRAAASSEGQGSSGKPKAPAEEGEWRRLVKAVTDAQRAAFNASTDVRPSLVARLLEPPSLPSEPAESWRGPIAFAGVVLGLVAGVLWALFRVFTWKRQNRVSSVPPPGEALPIAESQPGFPDELGAPERESFPSFHDADAPDAPARAPNPAAVEAALRASRDAPRVGPDGNVDIPPAPAVPSFGSGQTQIGMVDPAVFGARTESSGQRSSSRLEARPTVDVTSDRRPSSRPPVGTPSEDSSFGVRRSPVPSRGAMDSTSSQWVSSPQSRRSPSGVPTPRGVGRAPFQEEVAPITERVGTSDPGAHPVQSPPPVRNDAMAVVRPDTTYSYVDPDSRGARRRASERPGSDPPLRTSASAPDGRPPRGSPEIREPERRDGRDGRDARPLAANRPSSTQPGWARPTPPGVAAPLVRPSVPSRTPDPEEDAIVSPRSAPPSWRLRRSFVEEPAHEELNALRDQLLQQGRGRSLVVGVSSERPLGSAKSLIAARLAAMLAEDERMRVLLVEADFDFPSVHQLMAIEMPHSAGFSQQMRSRIKSNRRRPWVVVRCTPSLHVLAEGIVRSPGIVFSREFSEAIAELRRCYDIVIVDAPTAGAGEEHKAVDAIMDGLVFVVPSGGALSAALDRAGRWFSRKEFTAAVSAEPTRRD